MRLELVVNGTIFGGWKEVEFKRTWAAVSGDFSLGFSQRWDGQDTPRPVEPGDSVQIKADGQLMFSGFVDEDSLDINETSTSYKCSGRCKTGQLADCSAQYKGGTWKNAKLDRIAKDLASVYGVEVKAEANLGKPLPVHSIEPGETVLDCLLRACKQRGVLPVSTPKGELLLVGGSRENASDVLQLGLNIQAITTGRTFADRFGTYIVKTGVERGSGAGAGKPAAERAGKTALATDSQVKAKLLRQIVIIPDDNTQATAQQVANFEARIRAAKGETASVVLPSWFQSNGQLWREGLAVQVKADQARASGTWVVAECSYSYGDGGTKCSLALVRPDVFLQPLDSAPEDAGKKTKKPKEKKQKTGALMQELKKL